MSDACTSPLLFERIVEYWAGDLDAETIDRIDEHVLACAHCTTESAAVAGIVGALRTAIPPVVSAAQVRELESRGLVIEDNPVAPHERREVVFAPRVDILLHRLGGLDLTRATRVRVVIRVESSGEIMLEDDFVPFDRERGEVLIACQRHFAALPPDVLFEVHAHDDDGQASLARYVVPHVFGESGG